MPKQRAVYFGLAVGVFVQTSASAAVRYAKVSATGSGTCTSWANACTLNNAIVAAQFGDDVWVKMGTYPPFSLKDGVRIIGGFAGTETSASQSNPAANVTIVDGGGVQRCVRSYDNGPETMLRGFKITHGYDGDISHGGGLRLEDSSARIVQCIFEYNTAAYVGGAVMIYDSGSPQFINCTFRHNGSTDPDDPPYAGGAVFAEFGNSATFVNCVFYNNGANEGGVIDIDDVTTATFINCTLTYNRATWPYRHGGAIHDVYGGISLHNCILWGNTEGNGLLEQIYNPLPQYHTVATHSDVQGGWPGTANLNADPLFVNAGAADFRLATGSPCKDVGANSYVQADDGDLNWNGITDEDLPSDLAGNARIGDSVVDMGVYELGCESSTTDCNQNGTADPCEIEDDPTLDCHNQNGVLDLCETTAAVPRGACCVEFTCDWPTTSCACAADGGVWHQGKKCFQVTCGGSGGD